MTTQILEKLFGSAAKVKIMKLFLFNPDQTFDKVDVAKKTKVTQTNSQKELNSLEAAGLIKKTSFFKTVKLKTVSKKKRGRVLNNNSQIIDLIKNELNNNDYLMIKASNATGFNKFANNLKELK